MQKGNILIFTYYWPPSGGPNVQRWLTFTRLLQEQGFQCHVVTVDETEATYPNTDYSLVKEVHPGVKVHKTPTRELFGVYKKYIGKGKVPSNALSNEQHPNFLQKAARFARGNFFLPDPRRGWNSFALAKGKELIKGEDISLVITAGPPQSTHLVGQNLKQTFGLPWMVDFIDFWTNLPYIKKFYRLWPAKKIDAYYEYQTLLHADQIICDCQMAADYWYSKLPEKSRESYHAFSIAYDACLFDKPEQLAISTAPQKAFIITYTGAISAYFEPQTFFSVLRQIVAEEPEIRFILRFVGNLAETVKDMIRAEGLENILEETGYVDHQDSILYLYKSSALFLVSPVFEGEKMHVPGKLYEYLASEKPIINLTLPNSETAQIIDSCQAGETFNRDDAKGLYAYLSALVNDWKIRKNINLKNSQKTYRQYAYQNEAKRLGGLLEQMLSNHLA